MKNKFEKNLDNSITVILCVILFLIPMLIEPNRNYNLLRFRALLLCGFLLLIAFILKIRKIKFDLIDWSAAIFGMFVIICTFTSLSTKASLYGARNRYEGTFALLTYLLVYYHAKHSFKYNKSIKVIGLIVYNAICIFSIVQFYLPKNIVIYPIFGSGANGTFGNTNFMGSFVSLILPLFIFKFITSGKKEYYISCITAFSAMLMCAARSGWIAFFVYIVLIISYVAYNKNKAYLKRLGITAVTFIIVAVLITNIHITGKNNFVNNKFGALQKDITSIKNEGFSDKNGSGRIRIWKMCIEVLQKYPVFGCGVDNLDMGLTIASRENYTNYLYTMNKYIDKAHNEFLHIACTMGIFALIAYLVFLSCIIFPNLKLMWNDEKKMLLMVIIFSYLTQSFFNISTIGIAPIFWFVLGTAAKYTKIEITKKKKTTPLLP